jgi:hypothetical protein
MMITSLAFNPLMGRPLSFREERGTSLCFSSVQAGAAAGTNEERVAAKKFLLCIASSSDREFGHRVLVVTANNLLTPGRAAQRANNQRLSEGNKKARANLVTLATLIP